MTEFRKPGTGPVPHFETKFDNCTIKATGKPYRHQKGSGRSAILALATDGMKLGELTKAAAAIGYDPNFTVQSCLKQHNTKDGGWTVVAPEGTTLKEILAKREPRKVDPAKQAERDAKKKAAEEAKAKRLAEREEKQKAKDEEKAKKKAEREAAKKAAEEAAAKAKQAGNGGAQHAGEGAKTTAAAPKGPVKGKQQGHGQAKHA